MDTRLLYRPFDPLDRRVLYVVELIDPVSRGIVSRGIEVQADGLIHAPIVNRSGRFVWLLEGDAWPARILVPARDPRFEAVEVPALPRPPDVDKAKARERLHRITLAPTRVYDFGEGVTAMRGRLAESNHDDAPAIENAEVSLAWRDTAGGWHTAGTPIQTDRSGQFALFLRLPRRPTADVDKGLLRVRLQFVNANVGKVTSGFPFLVGLNDPRDRIPEGLLLYRDVPLGWAEL